MAISIRYGMPIQILITMTMTLARFGVPQKSMFCLMSPRDLRAPLTRPFRSNILDTYSREMNWGMAMVRIRMVRHIFFRWMPFLLIIMATKMPRK